MLMDRSLWDRLSFVCFIIGEDSAAPKSGQQREIRGRFLTVLPEYARIGLRRRSQVVRQGSAKPPFTGSNPVVASNFYPPSADVGARRSRSILHPPLRFGSSPLYTSNRIAISPDPGPDHPIRASFFSPRTLYNI